MKKSFAPKMHKKSRISERGKTATKAGWGQFVIVKPTVLLLIAAIPGLVACPAPSSTQSESFYAGAETLAKIATGIWIGFGKCGPSEITFSIAIRSDASSQGAFIAEAGGGLAPITLVGRPDGDGQTMMLKAKAWRMQDPSRQTSQFDLELTYLPYAEMLAITRIGVERDCKNLVARKVRQQARPANPKGLLFKASASPSAQGFEQTIEALTDEDCVAYAGWLAERHKALDASNAAHPTHPALYDPEGMVHVLGRDFLSWLDEDAYRFRNIQAACQAKLQKPQYAELNAVLRNIDSADMSGAPLTYPPNQPDSRYWYGPALHAIYADMIADMRIDQYRLSEGLDGADLSQAKTRYGDRRARLSSAPRSEFVGEWFGTIHCGVPQDSSSAERLVRLLVDPSAPEPWVELQLGPYKNAYTGSVGALRMSFDYNSQTHDVFIRSKHRDPSLPPAKSIEGKFDPATGMLTGVATGFTDISHGGCTQMTLEKVQRPAAIKNPDGLLFQLVLNPTGGVAAHRLTPKQCATFSLWQSEYETHTFGGQKLYAGLIDAARMREVFGKDIYQWDEADAARMKVLRGTCREILVKENDPVRLAALDDIDPASWFGWAVLETWPHRTNEGGNSEVSAEWFRTEQLLRDIVVNLQSP